MYKLLLVDDEPWALYGLKSSFEWAEKYFDKIYMTAGALEARDILCAENPDIVFSDIRMPDLSGLDLLKISKNNNLNAEFVFISGFSDFSYAQEALNHGAYSYLLKPIDNEEIRRVVNSLFEKLKQKHLTHTLKPAVPILPGEYVNKNFLDLLAYVGEHFKEDISLSSLSQKFYLNGTYISDLFKKNMKCSFFHYLTTMRLEHACFLLQNTCMSIKEISQKCGFREYHNLVRIFKQEYGVPPGLYRSELGREGQANVEY